MSTDAPLVALSRVARGPLYTVPRHEGDWFSFSDIARDSIQYVLCDEIGAWPRDLVPSRLNQIRQALRPGGVLRIVTEDLEAVVHDYWLGSPASNGTASSTPCASFNAWLRKLSDGFIYDETELSRILANARFTEIRRFVAGGSAHPVFWDDPFADPRALVIESQRPKTG